MSARKKGASMDAKRRALEDVERRTGKRLTGYKANYGDATPETRGAVHADEEPG